MAVATLTAGTLWTLPAQPWWPGWVDIGAWWGTWWPAVALIVSVIALLVVLWPHRPVRASKIRSLQWVNRS